MSPARRRRLAALTLLLGLAFALRIYRLDAAPLRGDEAFAVRYWAVSPATVIRDLARHEPHPLGTFLGFWAWKSAAGGSAFAMRTLPLLGSLMGVAGMAVLARRLFQDQRVAFLAAALWAINPFQIWHAQDARNYALWAGFSALAMWLFLRAADTNRRRDWGLYILFEALALYAFFLESFLLVVQAVYLLALRRSRPTTRAALVAWAILAVLLIPWFVQLGYLSQSGYSGTVGQADAGQLLTWFLPTLLTGEQPSSPWHIVVPLAWCALVAACLMLQKPRRPVTLFWLVAWILVPAGLLLAAAARMSVFHPRYLIVVTPALLLLMARAMLPGREAEGHRRRYLRVGAQIGLLIIPLLGFNDLTHYYRGENPKSPGWPRLVTYLDSRIAGSKDLVLQTLPDPAFRYYYHGSAREGTLTPGADIPTQLADVVNDFDTIWLVGRSPDAEHYLADQMQELSADSFSSFTVIQYRRWESSPGEIAVPLDIVFGEIARLRGYTLQGPDAATQAMTVLLYWEPLAQSGIDYNVFVHLNGPPRLATGSPLWDQDDHRPRDGFASTLSWQPGSLVRDPYHLLGDPAQRLLPGDYTLEIGVYDPADPNARLPVTDAHGTPLGSSYPLATVHWLPQ